MEGARHYRRDLPYFKCGKAICTKDCVGTILIAQDHKKSHRSRHILDYTINASELWKDLFYLERKNMIVLKKNNSLYTAHVHHKQIPTFFLFFLFFSSNFSNSFSFMAFFLPMKVLRQKYL